MGIVHLKQAERIANDAERTEREPFYILRHKETGELAVVRARFLHLWLDVFDVIPVHNGRVREQ